MSPTGITYFGISGYIVFWVIFTVAGGLFLHRMYQLVRFMFLGQKVTGIGQFVSRTVKTLFIVVGQWCQLKNLTSLDRASIGHAFMAWGFFAFSLFYFLFIIIGVGFGASETLEHTKFFFYYVWILDILAPLVMIGALWGIIRRFILRPARLKGEQSIEAMIILISVLFHPITHLLKEASSIALGHPPVGLGSVLPPVSNALSSIFNNSSVSFIETANVSFFWAHWLIVLFVLVFIAYSRYLHMIASVFNIFFRSPLPTGRLSSIDLENVENFGVSKITDFTWKQILDLYACVVCGNCQERCPATASGKSLNPKKLIQDLKEHLLDVGPALLKSNGNAEESADNPGPSLAGDIITEDDIWACTTCRACDEICPTYVDHVDKIVDMRRSLVMERSQMPDPVQQTLQSLTARDHPWRGTTFTRADWAEGLDIKVLSEDSNIDILYWVGCSAALEDRNIKVAQATARIMQAAGVNFGILSMEESCCGDPARRMGDEYLFQTLCEKNIEILNSYNIKKIITSCPHCFNTLANEYPQFKGDYEVVHHSQFILDLIKEGKIQIGGLDENKTITYHDSCYLGRYNGIFQQPRDILNSIDGICTVEMDKSKLNGFCCGGGGGHMWMEEDPDKRLNVKRTEQVIESKAEIVSTACPYCLAMFEDGLKTKGAEENIKALDLSELVYQAMIGKKEDISEG